MKLDIFVRQDETQTLFILQNKTEIQITLKIVNKSLVMTLSITMVVLKLPRSDHS